MDHELPKSAFHALTGIDCHVKVVDVGANPIDGTPPYATLLHSGRAEIIGFEPDPAALAQLNANKGPRETYLPYAVADGGRHLLRFCQAPGMNSLLEPNQPVLALFHGFPEWGHVVATRAVDTVRLDDVEETCGADLIKLDIQGGELLALRHAAARLADATVVQAEVEFLPLYVDQPLFADIDGFMRQNGFMFHRFFPEVSRVIRPLVVDRNIYAGLSQVVWADAVFIRDITRLDLLSDRQLLVMAAIMHDCYGSFDVTLHLLNEHERRRGTQFADVYLSRLSAHATSFHQPAAA
jgi:FkbM family methyltransferase